MSLRRPRIKLFHGGATEAVLAFRLLLIVLAPQLASCSRQRSRSAPPAPQKPGDPCAVGTLILEATDHPQSSARIEALAVDEKQDRFVAGTWTGKLQWGNRTPVAPEPSLFVAKISASGSPLWFSELGVGSVLSPGSMAVDADGNVLVAGSSALGGRRLPGRKPTAQLRRLDSQTGALLWEQDFAGEVWLAVVDASARQGGDAFVAGTTPSSSSERGMRPARTRDLFIARLTRQGAVRWQRRFGSNVPPLPPWSSHREAPMDDVRSTALVATPEGFVVGGSFDRRLDVDGIALQSSQTPAQFVIAFDGDGRRRWSSLEPSNSSRGLPLLSRTSAGVALLHSRERTGRGGPDIRLACLDSQGRRPFEHDLPFEDEPLSFTAPVFDRSIRFVALSRSFDNLARLSLTTIEADCEGKESPLMSRRPAGPFWPTSAAPAGPSMLLAGCRVIDSSQRCIAEVRCLSSRAHPAERRDR